MRIINKKTGRSLRPAHSLILAVFLFLISALAVAAKYKNQVMPPYPNGFTTMDERLSDDQKKILLWVKIDNDHLLWVADVHKLVENKPPEMTVTASKPITSLRGDSNKLELILSGCKAKHAGAGSDVVVLVDPGQKELKSAVKQAWSVNFASNTIKSIGTQDIQCDTSDAAGDTTETGQVVENPKIMACSKTEINTFDTLDINFGRSKSPKTGLTVLSPNGELFLLTFPKSKDTAGKNFKPIMEHAKFLASNKLRLHIKNVTAPFYSENSAHLAGNKKVFEDKGKYLFVLGEADAESGGVSCEVNLK